MIIFNSHNTKLLTHSIENNEAKMIEGVNAVSLSLNSPVEFLPEIGGASLASDFSGHATHPTVDLTIDSHLVSIESFGQNKFVIFNILGIPTSDGVDALKKNLISNPSPIRNFYIVENISPTEGQYIAISDCVLNTFRLEASVGGLPSMTFGYRGLKAKEIITNIGIEENPSIYSNQIGTVSTYIDFDSSIEIVAQNGIMVDDPNQENNDMYNQISRFSLDVNIENKDFYRMGEEYPAAIKPIKADFTIKMSKVKWSEDELIDSNVSQLNANKSFDIKFKTCSSNQYVIRFKNVKYIRHDLTVDRGVPMVEFTYSGTMDYDAVETEGSRSGAFIIANPDPTHPAN